MKKELRTLFSNALLLSILNVSGYIFSLISFPYLIRTLGPNNFGIIIIANANIAYFRMIVEFGFTLSGTKSCSLNRDNSEELSVITFSIIQGKLFLSILGLILLVLVLCFTNLLKGKEVIMILSYLQLFPAVFITDYLFRGLEKMGAITYRNIAVNILYTIATILLIRKSDDYYFYPIITALNSLAVAVWTWVYIYKNYKIKFKIVSIRQTINTIKDSFTYFLANIASTLYSSSNVVVLGYKGLSNTVIGHYGVANNVITVIRSIFSPVADSMYPYMVAKKNFRLIKLILIIGCPLSIIGTFILYLWARPIIMLLGGKEYLDAIPIFKTMLPLIVITLPMYLLGYSTLGAMGKAEKVNLTVVYGSIIHILGLLILLGSGKLNITSVIILSIFSESSILISRIIYIYKSKVNRKIENLEKSFPL
jgi:PST family polysaccharide transporter